ncbi:hypothetical protein BC943DRAFT_339894 [Umbelopsis sp. AD052]|nr:hypothetical protein BC943DRAFT_339894 [Umbelopsis sp. AD052]
MPIFPSEEGIVKVLSQSMVVFGKVKNVSIFKKPVGHETKTKANMNQKDRGTTTQSWSDIVRRGREMTIPSILARQREEKPNIKTIAKTVYEAEGFENERRAHQAAAIIKRALYPNTVLFEIEAASLSKDEVYDLITKEIGVATGFRPISEYRGNGRGNWLIEAKFRDSDDAKKACEIGLVHEGIKYLATPWIENSEKVLTKVNLTHLPLEHQDDIKEGLIHSMEKYGQICQIKIFTTARGYFEGEATVLLDTTKEGEDY